MTSIPVVGPYPEVASFDDLPGTVRCAVDIPAVTDAGSTPQTRSRRRLAQVEEPGVPQHRAQSVVQIPNGHVIGGSGAILSASGRLVRESLWDDNHWRRSFARPAPLAIETHVEGRVASLISLWSDVYYHWMLDCLPRLAVLEASGLPYDRLLVPENLTGFQLESLHLLGVPEHKLLPYTRSHVTADEILWISPASHIGFPTAFSINWLRTRLGATEVAPTRRIFLRRTGSRGVHNERTVLRQLLPLGYEVVIAEHLGLAEQISLFSETRVAVGSHGSAFTNALFSSRLTALEFYHSAHANSSITTLLAAAGHSHHYMRCPRVPALTSRNNRALWVPKRPLQRALEDIESGR